MDEPVLFTVKEIKFDNDNVELDNETVKLNSIPPLLQGERVENYLTLGTLNKDLKFSYDQEISRNVNIPESIHKLNKQMGCIPYKIKNMDKLDKINHKILESVDIFTYIFGISIGEGHSVINRFFAIQKSSLGTRYLCYTYNKKNMIMGIVGNYLKNENLKRLFKNALVSDSEKVKQSRLDIENLVKEIDTLNEKIGNTVTFLNGTIEPSKLDKMKLEETKCMDDVSGGAKKSKKNTRRKRRTRKTKKGRRTNKK